MASLSKDPGKGGVLYRLLFKSPAGERKSIRLGSITAKQATNILGHVDHLERCGFDGSAPPVATAAWLDTTIGADLRGKLVKHGLAAAKVQARPARLTVDELIARFKERPKWQTQQPNTTRAYNLNLGYLQTSVGGNTRIDALTEAQADDYIGTLMAKCEVGLATATRACGVAVTLFKFAVRSRLLDRNPFEGVPCSDTPAGRKAFVEAAVVTEIIKAIDDTQLKLIIALSRWGGLRVPSEPRELRWGDIDRERNRIRVPSPKTACHAGHESREIPLFPELVPYLQDRWDEAEAGELYVLPMMRKHRDSVYATRLSRTMRALGINPWPRLFHSMRSTRQTELTEDFPAHVVNRWLGNSEKIAAKNYLQVTDAHYAKAAHNAAQTASASVSQDATNEGQGSGERLDSRGVA